MVSQELLFDDKENNPKTRRDKKKGGNVSASFAQLLGGSDFPQLIKFVNKAVSLADAEMAY